MRAVRTDFVDGTIDDVRFYTSPLTSGVAKYIGTAGQSTVEIAMGSTGITVSPDLYGAFMEDINYGAEGGVYSNEVRNSGFNDATNALNAWSVVTGSGVAAALDVGCQYRSHQRADEIRQAHDHLGRLSVGSRGNREFRLLWRGRRAVDHVHSRFLCEGHCRLHGTIDGVA